MKTFLNRLIGWNTATTDLLYKEEESSGDERRVEEAIGFAANAAAPLSDDEWILLAPYGEWQDGSPQRWRQVFTPELAEKMARSFNSLPGKMGRFFRGAGIYIGHPDCDPRTYTDHRRLGKITELRAGAEGLEGKASWNDLGRENLAQGFYVYPSVAWRFPRPRPGDDRVYPDVFQSVGLTNWPAGNVPPVTRNAMEPAAESDESTHNDDNDMKKELLALLGLDENATAEQVQAAVAAALGTEETQTEGTEGAEGGAGAEAESAEDEEEVDPAPAVNAATAELETARNALAEIRTREATGLIETALAAGRITAAERPQWEADFLADHETARNALAARKDVVHGLNTDPLTLDTARRKVTDANARMTAMNEAVERIRQEKGVNYETAWDMAKRDEKTRHLFEPVSA